MKNIFRTILAIVGAASLLIAADSCTKEEPNVAVTGITLDKTSVELTEGESFTLKATVTPSNATDPQYTWSSSNTSVAVVTDGTVTAAKAGTATITVKTNDGGKTATCTVTVKASVISVESVEVDTDEITLYKGADTYQVTATINPADATNQDLAWSSSDETIATVSQDGEIEPVGSGECLVTVRSVDNPDATVDIKVTVICNVEGIKVNTNEISLTEGKDPFQIVANVTPEDATNQELTWSSSDENIAIVSESGNVQPVGVGECVITVTSVQNPEISVDIKVTVVSGFVSVTGVTLDKSEATIHMGETLTLTATVQPEDATNKDLAWSSSDENVAVVSQDGEVQPIASGECTISVRSVDNSEASAEVKLTVICDVESIEVNTTEVNIAKGSEPFQIVAKVLPEGATNKELTWSSSDENVAMVSKTGKVQPVGVGQCVITVQSVQHPEISVDIKVTVKSDVVKVTDVAIDKSSAIVQMGQTLALTATVYPDNATNKNVNWSSSDKTVATVDQLGNVTPVKVGTCTISVITEDGGKNAVCNLTVVDTEITSISISTPDKTVYHPNESYKPWVEMKPESASNKSYTLSVSPSEAAYVSGKSVVFKQYNGSVTITATSEVTLSAKATVTVNVQIPVSSVSVNSESLIIGQGSTYTLKATVLPSNAYDYSLTWSSDDETVATVDASGVVTGVHEGTCNIKATSNYDSSISATCNVTVNGLNYISINDGPEISYEVGKLADVIASAGTVTSLKWTKSTLMGGADVAALRTSELASSVTSVDMAKVNFIADGVKYNTHWKYTGTGTVSENVMPDYILAYYGNMTSLVLPENIKYVGDHSVYYCSSLTSITFPEKLQQIGYYSFGYCSGLSGTLVVPDTITRLDGTAFSSAKYTKVVIGSGLKNVYGAVWSPCFNECPYITEIKVTEDNPYFKDVDGILCSKDGKQLISYPVAGPDADKITPEGVTELCMASIYYVKATGSFTVSEGVTTIRSNGLREMQTPTLILPSTLTTMEAYALYLAKINTIVVNATTPPTCNTSVFKDMKGLTDVYVPDASVEAYKSADEWSTIASKIKPLSERP